MTETDFKNLRIAVITPGAKEDYLVHTVVDGFESLRAQEQIGEVYYTANNPRHFGIKKYELERDAFIKFAHTADIILYCWGKKHDYADLVHTIGRYDITAYIDGSELGHNVRTEAGIIGKIENNEYHGQGGINFEMLKICAAYFRREKPYVQGILPLPYGILRSYTHQVVLKNFNQRIYDIFCVFGQTKFPILRQDITAVVTDIKKKGILKVWNQSTKLPFISAQHRVSRQRFYKKLADSRIGISVSGGGYDTARFWEILGSGAFLFTEKIDINLPTNTNLPHELYTEFDPNLDCKKDFETIVQNFHKKILELPQSVYEVSYARLLEQHSSMARVIYILNIMYMRCKLGKPVSITFPATTTTITCHVCHTVETTHHANKDGYSLYKCSLCNLVFVYPQLTQKELAEKVYSEKVGYQANKIKDISRVSVTKPFSKVLNYIDSQRNTFIKNRVCDVGASNGEFLIAARSRGYETCGVELNASTAAVANSHHLNVAVGTLADAQYNNNSCDVVYMGDVIEHVTSPRELLQEVHRITDDNGCVIISTPNLNCFWARFTQYMYKKWGIPVSSFTPPYHLFQFSDNNLDVLLNEVGFNVVTRWYNKRPTLKYELGALHIFKKVRTSHGHKKIKALVYVTVVYLLYSIVYGLANVLSLISNNHQDFSMVTVARKIKK